MKNRQVILLYQLFEEISKENYEGIEFSYFIIKNRKLLKERAEEIQEAIKPPREFVEYDTKRLSLLEKYSADVNGVPEKRDIGNGNVEYVIQDAVKDEFNTEIQKLKDVYGTVLNDYETNQISINDFLNKDIDDISFKKLKQMQLPKNIKIRHVDAIFEFLDEE